MNEGTLKNRSARFLIAYCKWDVLQYTCNTPHSTTGASSWESMFGWRIYTRLNMIKPSKEAGVEMSQLWQKRGRDQHAPDRTFSAKEDVYVRNFGPGEVWSPGIITQVSSPGSYTVELSDVRSVRRHQDHLNIVTCNLYPYLTLQSSESAPTDPKVRPVRDSLPTTTPTPVQRACPSLTAHETPPLSPSQMQWRYPTGVRQSPETSDSLIHECPCYVCILGRGM